jgi:hypothetical protein
MKILYCGFGWASNIGNAFIDYGIEYQLRTVAPTADLVFASNMQNWLKNKYNYNRRLFPQQSSSGSDFEIRSSIQADYVVFAGALFNQPWFSENMELLEKLTAQGKHIIILGGSGGNHYTPAQIEFVSRRLKKLNIFALISRDHPTFNNFAGLAQHSHDGIDNAFFLKEAFTPAILDSKPFAAATFDHIDEPTQLTDLRKLRLYHSAWNLGRIESFLKAPLKTWRLMQSNDIISDFPDDYLHIYANAEVTYSDRVHACLSALVFGKKAQYFGRSPRSLLFDRIELATIREQPVTLDQTYIADEKAKQMAFLTDIMKNR